MISSPNFSFRRALLSGVVVFVVAASGCANSNTGTANEDQSGTDITNDVNGGPGEDVLAGPTSTDSSTGQTTAVDVPEFVFPLSVGGYEIAPSYTSTMSQPDSSDAEMQRFLGGNAVEIHTTGYFRPGDEQPALNVQVGVGDFEELDLEVLSSSWRPAALEYLDGSVKWIEADPGPSGGQAICETLTVDLGGSPTDVHQCLWLTGSLHGSVTALADTSVAELSVIMLDLRSELEGPSLGG